jgi:quercetin dioxygenase-like cupin family protein
MAKTILFLLFFFTTILTFGQTDSSGDKHHIVTPEDIVWQTGPPTLPPGPKYFAIEGHPMKEGPVIMRLLLPAGYVIPAHHHPGAERTTIISGTYNMGTGTKFDKAKCKKMPAGSVVVMPAGGIPHYGWASEETIVQVHIDGPLQITYVNPDDDPRIKK